MNRRFASILRLIHHSIRVCRAANVLIIEVAALIMLLVLVIRILISH
jgi:hypothetical protein